MAAYVYAIVSDVATKSVYRPRRALLYMPGSNPKMLTKAASLQVDSVCMDLEDAVAPNKKVEARANIVTALTQPMKAEKIGKHSQTDTLHVKL